MIFSRLLWVYGGLLVLSLVVTRFVPPPSVALTSGISPLTRLGQSSVQNVRHMVDGFILERDLSNKYVALLEQNQNLTGENVKLKAQLEVLQQATQIMQQQSPALVTMAPVIALDPSPLLARVTVRAGTDQGVTRFMTATVPAGVVGQVISVGRNESVVLTLIDPESKVGVTIAGKGGRGIASGVRPGRLRAEFPKGTQVAIGDRVLTSNYGGVFPSSLMVGIVETVLPPGPNSLVQVIVIKPAVDFPSLESVGLLRAL